MKLHTKHMIPFDDRRELSTVLTARDSRIGKRGAKGMREIHKRLRWHFSQEPGGRGDQQLVPPHVRRFHACGKAFAFALKQAETGGFRRLLAALKHPLHADTDAEKRDLTLDGISDGVL